MRRTIIDFTQVTEVPGDPVSHEQIARLSHRYKWAAERCVDKNVLEVGCGSGVGLALLSTVANSVIASDISSDLLELAKSTQDFPNLSFIEMGVEDLWKLDASFDVIICFECIYYFQNLEKAISILSDSLAIGGKIIFSYPNCGAYDFIRSKGALHYFSNDEIRLIAEKFGFSCKFFGVVPFSSVPLRQKILRPLKAIAGKSGLVPTSMLGKAILKKLFFGETTVLPASVPVDAGSKLKAYQLCDATDSAYKVFYCEMTKL